MPLKRYCPVCQTELVYANLPGYRRACQAKSICRRCAASPSVVHRRLKEAEERRAAKNLGAKPLAAFFAMVEADISGSMAGK